MQVNPARLQAITHRTGHVGGQVVTHMQNLLRRYAQRLRRPIVHITKGFGTTVRPRAQDKLKVAIQPKATGIGIAIGNRHQRPALR